ncbi:MAG: hypothetical protein Q7S43_05255, partial [bacterium]|nr:hypothetical protein [bacterium]
MTGVRETFERGAARHRRLAADGFNVMRRFWLIGVIACVLAGGMAVSPLTVATAISLALIVAGACRGLTGLERRVVLTILLVAIGLRVLAILGLFITSDAHHLAAFPFDGDGSFLKQRSLWIRNVWLSIPIDSSQFSSAFQDYGWTGYIYVIGYLQYLLGPAPYAVHLFNVCCFIGGAVLLHGMVRTSYGPSAAIVLLMVTLFLPTLFMWSISALKESLFFLLLTTCLVGLVQTARGTGALQRIAGCAAVFAAAAVLDTIRAGALFIVAAATALALVATFVTKRVYVLVLALLLLPAIGSWVLQRPSIQARVLAHVQQAASVHIGHVRSQGHGYKLLDQRFYSGDPFESMTWNEARRFAVRAVFSFITVPAPWQVSSRSELLFLPQQLIWYCLVLLAVVGSIQGLRGDVFVTWVFIGMSCAGAAAIAMNSGNIGTLVRHRDSIVVPFVACLSAL